MSALRSSLALHPTRRRDAEQVKRDGWREMGVLAIGVDDQRLDPFEREVIARIGRRLYGPRGDGGKPRGGGDER